MKMNAYNSYPDKENVRVGQPVVKDSEVDKVKRNLSIGLPLKSNNQLVNNNSAKTPSSFLSGRIGVDSPITELAHNFNELAAHESSCNNTPKRRLSLTSSSGSPTPESNRIHSLSSSSMSSAEKSDASGSSKKEDAQKLFLVPTRKALEPRASGSFRRYNSMPYNSAYGANSEASPQLYQPLSKCTLASPLSLPNSQPVVSFSLGNDETSVDSHDSGFGKEERFNFVAPNIPPERAQLENELSPEHSASANEMTVSPEVAVSPELRVTTAEESSNSPLLTHRFCSEGENDDGFIDFDDLEKQTVCNVPDSIANMLTGKMVTSTSRVTKKLASTSQFRGKLFRSPSMPQQLSQENNYDIRRRVLCGNKRPDPPNDSTTPVAVFKKRRGTLSDGNMPPVPRKPDTQLAMSGNRLQRCKSLIEQSVTFQRNKSDGDGLTGDMRRCCLPLIKGKHNDLNSISHDTMAQIVNKEFDHLLSGYTIIDCRYPYEFDGGHIKGAENIYTKEEIYSQYIEEASLDGNRLDDKRNVLIFHCEFSSERAPKLSRFLRGMDRLANDYPSLFHPELYLLEGGFKLFYEHHKDLCEPISYKPMLHKDHSEDLKMFRAKSKSAPGLEKRGGFRPGLNKHLSN